jgi:hypothetical protein
MKKADCIRSRQFTGKNFAAIGVTHTIGVTCCVFFLLCGLHGVSLHAQTAGSGNSGSGVNGNDSGGAKGIAVNGEAVFAFPLGDNRARFNEICTALSGRPFVRGNFTQTKTISRLNRSLVSEGNFIIAEDMGMVWETLLPFPSTMAVGKDFLVQATPSGAKTKLDAKGNETFLRFSDTISAVFSGNSQKLLDNFTVYFTETEGIWTLGLIPSEKAIRSFAAQIIMSGETPPASEKAPLEKASSQKVPSQKVLIRTVILREQNGDSIRYTLSGHSFPASLSAAERNLFAQ